MRFAWEWVRFPLKPHTSRPEPSVHYYNTPRPLAIAPCGAECKAKANQLNFHLIPHKTHKTKTQGVSTNPLPSLIPAIKWGQQAESCEAFPTASIDANCCLHLHLILKLQLTKTKKKKTKKKSEEKSVNPFLFRSMHSPVLNLTAAYKSCILSNSAGILLTQKRFW